MLGHNLLALLRCAFPVAWCHRPAGVRSPIPARLELELCSLDPRQSPPLPGCAPDRRPRRAWQRVRSALRRPGGRSGEIRVGITGTEAVSSGNGFDWSAFGRGRLLRQERHWRWPAAGWLWPEPDWPRLPCACAQNCGAAAQRQPEQRDAKERLHCQPSNRWTQTHQARCEQSRSAQYAPIMRIAHLQGDFIRLRALRRPKRDLASFDSTNAR